MCTAPSLVTDVFTELLLCLFRRHDYRLWYPEVTLGSFTERREQSCVCASQQSHTYICTFPRVEVNPGACPTPTKRTIHNKNSGPPWPPCVQRPPQGAQPAPSPGVQLFLSLLPGRNQTPILSDIAVNLLFLLGVSTSCLVSLARRPPTEASAAKEYLIECCHLLEFSKNDLCHSEGRRQSSPSWPCLCLLTQPVSVGK